MYTIDMNCDLGESFGVYSLGRDREIIPLVSSVNIACGFHAGDPSVMRKTVALAMENKTAIGAHPGFFDLLGFGRRKMQVSSQEAYDLVLYQIGALHGFVRAAGGRLHHVKPHGALYNMAAVDENLARAVAEAVYDVDPTLILYGLAGSHSLSAAQSLGLRSAAEVFADRAYQADGSLMPRNLPGAVLTDEAACIRQVLMMVKTGKVQAGDGSQIGVQADTICIHGDGPMALAFAQQLRLTLEQENVQIKAAAICQE